MDLVPCEICERHVPFEGYNEHVTRCLRATQIARFLLHQVRVRVPDRPAEESDTGDEADDEAEDLSRHLTRNSQVSRVTLHDFIQNHFQRPAQPGAQRSAVVWFNISARAQQQAQSYESNLRLGDALGAVRVGLTDAQLEEVACSTCDREALRLADDDACAVCQERLQEKPAEEKLCLLACGHVYCDECIRQWLQKSKKCPVCMVDLEDAYCWGR